MTIPIANGNTHTEDNGNKYNERPKLERTLRGHKTAVTDVAFNPSPPFPIKKQKSYVKRTQIASASRDGSVMLWNFFDCGKSCVSKKGSCREMNRCSCNEVRAYRFSGHTAPVNHVRYSPSGHLLASCSSDKTVRLWLPNVNGDSVVLRGHNGPVRCVDFSQSATGTSFGNESFLATCSDDKTIKIWNLPSKSFKCTFLGHTNWVRACQFSKDNWNLCASGSDDNTIRTWDIESAKNISTYPFERACGSNSMNSKRRGTTFSDSVGVRSIDFHPTGASLAAAGANGNINLYDLRSDKLVQTFPFSSDNSKNTRIKFQSGNITFHPSGNYLLCSSVRSSNKAPGYKLWDLRRHQCLYSILPSSENMEDSTAPCAFSSDGSRFCSVGSNASVLVWNTFSLQNDTKVDTNLESPKENIITDIGECKKNNYNHPQQEYVVEDVATNTLEEVNPFDKSTVRSSNHQQYVGKNEINQNVLVGALEHIVGQLDMLTKTIGLLDKRLAIIEDCHKKKVDQISRTTTS